MYLAIEDGAISELDAKHRQHRSRLPDPTAEAVTIMLPADLAEMLDAECRDYRMLRRNDVIRYLVGRGLWRGGTRG